MNMSKESITTVVFDASFTLWNPDFHATCELVGTYLGIPRPYKHTFEKQLCKSLFKLRTIAKDETVTPEFLARQLGSLMHEVLQASNITATDVINALRIPDFSCCKIKPDALDTVMYLWKSNKRQILKSDWWAEVQIVQLRKFGLYPYFEAVYGPLWSYFKPHAKGGSKFLKNLNPEHFLMVGDSIDYDIKFAKNTGMKSAWLNPTGVKNNSKINPDITIKRLSELTIIL